MSVPYDISRSSETRWNRSKLPRVKTHHTLNGDNINNFCVESSHNSTLRTTTSEIDRPFCWILQQKVSSRTYWFHSWNPPAVTSVRTKYRESPWYPFQWLFFLCFWLMLVGTFLFQTSMTILSFLIASPIHVALFNGWFILVPWNSETRFSINKTANSGILCIANLPSSHHHQYLQASTNNMSKPFKEEHPLGELFYNSRRCLQRTTRFDTKTCCAVICRGGRGRIWWCLWFLELIDEN
jgi:hypothetical protein